MEVACRTAKRERITPIQKMVGPMAPRGYYHPRVFKLWHLILVAVLTAICTTCALPVLSGVAGNVVSKST